MNKNFMLVFMLNLEMTIKEYFCSGLKDCKQCVVCKMTIKEIMHFVLTIDLALLTSLWSTVVELDAYTRY